MTSPAYGPRSYPRVAGCRHCGLAVLRDNDGAWIHASLSYVCRDRWGGIRETTAEPTPSDPNPIHQHPNQPPRSSQR